MGDPACSKKFPRSKLQGSKKSEETPAVGTARVSPYFPEPRSNEPEGTSAGEMDEEEEAEFAEGATSCSMNEPKPKALLVSMLSSDDMGFWVKKDSNEFIEGFGVELGC